MPYIRELSDGKCQVMKDLAFTTLLESKLPNENVDISSLFDELDRIIRQRDTRVSSGALSNTHGDWYEWLLAIQTWNCFVNNPNLDLAVLLPNVSQFSVAKLYTPDLSELIQDLRTKVEDISQVRLITSNPDFVIIESALARTIIQDPQPITELTIDTIAYLSTIFSRFIGLCSFNQIIGYISVKTSFRPDRRLQIAHEGSLMKAIYTHLQTRQWIINPKGLKYFAIATKVGIPDREALKTVATHSITTVSSLPQAAVDEVFEINSLRQAKAVFEKILLS